MRRIISATIVSALIFAPVQSVAAGREPVRSGSTLGGFLVMAGRVGPDCAETPDCRVWLESDCDPDYPLVSDPALYTSIVDVADLAGLRRQRRFRMELSGGYGIGWGGVTVQFWNAACNEINPSPTLSSRLTATVSGKTNFKIPAGAAWMTLASWDTVRVNWTLS